MTIFFNVAERDLSLEGVLSSISVKFKVWLESILVVCGDVLNVLDCRVIVLFSCFGFDSELIFIKCLV